MSGGMVATAIQHCHGRQHRVEVVAKRNKSTGVGGDSEDKQSTRWYYCIAMIKAASCPSIKTTTIKIFK